MRADELPDLWANARAVTGGALSPTRVYAKYALTLTLPLAGPSTHALTYLLLAVWGLFGPRRALEALTLTWLITFLNPGVYELSQHTDVLRWFVVACAAASIMVTAILQRASLPRAILWLAAFGGIAAIMAAGVSYAPAVSLFKLGSFLVLVGSVVIGYHVVAVPSSYWRLWFLTLFAAVVIASLPLIALDVGYVRNERGFQGVLNHPQAYGAFLGAMTAWVLFLRLEGGLKRGWGWALLACAGISLILTEARTAAIATVGTLAVVGIWSVLRRPDLVRHIGVWGVRLAPLIGLGGVLLVYHQDSVRSAIATFVLKDGVERTVGESFRRSRGALMAQSWENFREQPLTGIGFGVASDPALLTVRRDPVFGLPVGASVEKGSAVTGALEELGLLGTGALLLFLLSWIRPLLWRAQSLAPLALVSGALLVNLGEAIFFAVGGSGLVLWLLLGSARVSASHQIDPKG